MHPVASPLQPGEHSLESFHLRVEVSITFLVQNPREVAAIVYKCKKACCFVVHFRSAVLKFTMFVCLVEYDTSGCGAQVISWLPSHGNLGRSMLASKRLRDNQQLGLPELLRTQQHIYAVVCFLQATRFQVTFDYKAERAWLAYRSAVPLSAKDAAAVGIDVRHCHEADGCWYYRDGRPERPAAAALQCYRIEAIMIEDEITVVDLAVDYITFTPPVVEPVQQAVLQASHSLPPVSGDRSD